MTSYRYALSTPYDRTVSEIVRCGTDPWLVFAEIWRGVAYDKYCRHWKIHDYRAK